MPIFNIIGGGSGLSVETGEVDNNVGSTRRFDITTKLSKITHYTIVRVNDSHDGWPIVAIVDGHGCAQNDHLMEYLYDEVTTSLRNGKFTVNVDLPTHINFTFSGKYYYALFGE